MTLYRVAETTQERLCKAHGFSLCLYLTMLCQLSLVLSVNDGLVMGSEVREGCWKNMTWFVLKTHFRHLWAVKHSGIS